MHLDVHPHQLGQGPVDDQPLVQKAGRGLHDVGAEAAGDAHRIVGGVDRDADALEQALVLERLHPVP